MIAVAIGWCAVFLASARLPGYWAGRNPRFVAQMKAIWPYGDRLFVGWLKALPLILLCFAVAIFGVTVDMITSAAPGAADGPARAIELVAYGLAAASSVLALVVALTGMPSAFVPPWLRGVTTLEE